MMKNELLDPYLVFSAFPGVFQNLMYRANPVELSVKEDPSDDRATFWLGREYLYYQKYDSAIETLKQYLKLPAARWGEERSAAMRFIAQSYEKLQDGKAAMTWLFRAIEECPTVREPYLAFARLAYEEKNWPLVYTMVRSALSITQKSGSYLMEPECWGAELYDLGAVSAYYLGLYGKAEDHAEKACKMRPADERLKSNLELIRQRVQEQAD